MQQPIPSMRPASYHSPRAKAHTNNAFKVRVLKKGAEEENAWIDGKEFFRIIWIKEGSGILHVDMRTDTAGDDTIYCLKPGQAVKFQQAEKMDGYMISFSADFLAMAGEEGEPLYHSSLFHPLLPFSIIKVKTNLKPEMLEAVERMVREFSNTYPGKEEILRGLLKIFMIYLNRQQDGSGQQIHLNQSGLASRFFSLLEKNFANRKMVSDYAQELSVTPNYLNETVKKASGFSASHHIQQRIILEAKRKAAYVRKSMKEIAYDLGFDDISHFSKYFKKVSGINFSDFKREISQQFGFAAAS